MAGDSISGVGVLIVDGQRYAGAGYRIEMAPAGNRRLQAAGALTMTAEHAPIIRQAMFAGSAELELENGQSLQIIPTSMGVLESPPSFEFVAAGPIPGYEV